MGAIVALSIGVVLGQQRLPDRFATRVDVVLADFTASAKDGQPVLNLTVDDLRLSIDGKRREIQSLDLVRFDAMAGRQIFRQTIGRDRSSGEAGAESHVVSGRQIFLIFDEDAIRPNDEREPQQAALRFIQKLNDDDRVAVLALPGGEVATDLTTDREATALALARIRGRLPAPPVTIDQATKRACEDHQRTQQTLSRLMDVMTAMKRLDGVKTVALISSGLVPPTATRQPTAGPSCAQTAVDVQQFTALGVAVTAAEVHMYVIQPHGFLIEAGGPRATPMFIGYPDYHAYLDAQLSGLETVAGVTGGDLRLLSANGDAVFSEIALASSAYYVLGFTPLPAEHNGKAHKIKLETNRSGVAIRARSAFTVQ